MSVKDKKRGRPARAQSQLTAALIVDQARNLMKENGKVPSIRQVSGALGVDAMAIYYYFANKSALLEALTVSLLDDIYQPTETGSWQQELANLCKSYLQLLAAYPGLLETLLSMKTFGPVQLFDQRLQQALNELQLAQDEFANARDLLVDYMHGVALSVQCNADEVSIDCIDGPLQMICSLLASRGR